MIKLVGDGIKMWFFLPLKHWKAVLNSWGLWGREIHSPKGQHYIFQNSGFWRLSWSLAHYYQPPTKLQEGNVFSHVCQFVGLSVLGGFQSQAILQTRNYLLALAPLTCSNLFIWTSPYREHPPPPPPHLSEPGSGKWAVQWAVHLVESFNVMLRWSDGTFNDWCGCW